MLYWGIQLWELQKINLIQYLCIRFFMILILLSIFSLSASTPLFFTLPTFFLYPKTSWYGKDYNTKQFPFTLEHEEKRSWKKTVTKVTRSAYQATFYKTDQLIFGSIIPRSQNKFSINQVSEKTSCHRWGNFHRKLFNERLTLWIFRPVQYPNSLYI